jgi:hypothetical protein
MNSLMNENKDIWDFYYFCRFSTQFPYTISKASSLCCAIVLSQEDSKLADLVLHGVKKTLFLISNAKILQSMWSSFLRLFPHTILILKSKILQLNEIK